MSKRFTESTKFRDSWYRKLKPKHKCLWEFFLSECNIAGIFEIDYESMSFHIGEKITKEDLEIFNDRIVFICEDKIFIQKFILFQQVELNENNRAHINIIKILKELNLDYKAPIADLKRSFEGPRKELASSYSNSNSNIQSLSNSNIDKEYVKFYSKLELNKYAEFVYMEEKDFNFLISKYSEEYTNLAIEKLNIWKLEKLSQGKSKECKGDDYRKICKWVMMAVIEDQKKLNYNATQKVIANIEKVKDPEVVRKCNEMIDGGYMKWEHAKKFTKEQIEDCYLDFIKDKQLEDCSNE